MRASDGEIRSYTSKECPQSSAARQQKKALGSLLSHCLSRSLGAASYVLVLTDSRGHMLGKAHCALLKHAASDLVGPTPCHPKLSQKWMMWMMGSLRGHPLQAPSLAAPSADVEHTMDVDMLACRVAGLRVEK